MASQRVRGGGGGTQQLKSTACWCAAATSLILTVQWQGGLERRKRDGKKKMRKKEENRRGSQESPKQKKENNLIFYLPNMDTFPVVKVEPTLLSEQSLQPESGSCCAGQWNACFLKFDPVASSKVNHELNLKSQDSTRTNSMKKAFKSENSCPALLAAERVQFSLIHPQVGNLAPSCDVLRVPLHCPGELASWSEGLQIRTPLPSC